LPNSVYCRKIVVVLKGYFFCLMQAKGVILWAEELAKQIEKDKGLSVNRAEKEIFISTMITPSGPIHLGNLKEVMVGYLISEALKNDGLKVSFNFFADNFDYLRKLYPFLPKRYEKYIGFPLSEIPDLWGCHKTYDEHFLQPFLEALKVLKIKPKVRYIDKLYKNGTYASMIQKALENKERIAQIISSVSGREISKDWSPFLPRCEECGRMSTTKVIETDLVRNSVVYQCECGHRGVVDFSKGGGKLVWRAHWPATWRIFGVGVEGFGKDLATKGGAFDTARQIVEKVFNGKPPFPIPYEWVYVKGEGRMAGSTGIGFTPLEVLEVLPPEILIYFYKRTRPNKHHEFDIQESVVNLWNEYGGLSGVPFQHLVMAAQSFRNLEDILESLKRSGYDKQIKDKRAKIKDEINYVRNWLRKYASEKYKFEIQKELPKAKLTKKQKEFLSNILETVVKTKLDGEELHQKIHQIKNEIKINPREAFSAIYKVFLGQDSGPQAGWFLAGLDRRFVIRRLKEATKP